MKRKLSSTCRAIINSFFYTAFLTLFLSSGVNAQQTFELVVSINGITYEDPALSLLKESLKNNKKVKSTKNSFDQETAKITLSCSTSATDLWDDVPKTTKDFFKLTSIDDKHITLQYKNGSQSNVPNTNTTATLNTKIDDDCKNCYFNLCKYDGLRTFQGVVFKQINKDDGTYYYNCDNGILVQKQVIQNGYGVITKITNDTLLRSDLPVGAAWGEYNNENSIFGMTVNTHNIYKMAAKGISLTVNGTTYHDVIMINYSGRTDDNTFGNSSFSTNYYYAKGVGLIKTEVDKLETTDLDALVKTMKGKIDETITGTWKFHDNQMNWDIYYVFNLDGSYQYYVGAINRQDLMSDPKSYWRLDGAYLELAGGGWNQVYRYELQKKNDPATGKPALVIEWKGAERRAYIATDNKKPW